jgi:hypothetical protein
LVVEINSVNCCGYEISVFSQVLKAISLSVSLDNMCAMKVERGETSYGLAVKVVEFYVEIRKFIGILRQASVSTTT